MHPPHFSLEASIRPHILALPNYRTSTSDEFRPRTGILLDANENSFGSCLMPYTRPKPTSLNGDAILKDKDGVPDILSLHRYPSVSQWQLKHSIARWRNISDVRRICLGAGGADVIDLIIRVTCCPQKSAILITSPTFGFYRARAAFNDVNVVDCPLDMSNDTFKLCLQEVKAKLSSDSQVKVVFLASPGNPTGTLIPLSDIKSLLDFPDFTGLLVVDEAYIDFAPSAESASAMTLLSEYSNLVVIQTLSKSLGLAAIRLGIAFGNPLVIEQFNKVQIPFCIPTPTSALAISALAPVCGPNRFRLIHQVTENRKSLVGALAQEDLVQLGVGTPLGEHHANFLMLPILCIGEGPNRRRDNFRAERVCEALEVRHDIIVRFIGSEFGCEGCIRIAIGTEAENRRLVDGLRDALKVC